MIGLRRAAARAWPADRFQHPAQVIAAGFGTAVAIGTGLLSVPAATASGEPAEVVDALFTATSAVCVTGLVRPPASSAWKNSTAPSSPSAPTCGAASSPPHCWPNSACPTSGPKPSAASTATSCTASAPTTSSYPNTTWANALPISSPDGCWTTSKSTRTSPSSKPNRPATSSADRYGKQDCATSSASPSSRSNPKHTGPNATFTYATPDTTLMYGDVILVVGAIKAVERFAAAD